MLSQRPTGADEGRRLEGLFFLPPLPLLEVIAPQQKSWALTTNTRCGALAPLGASPPSTPAFRGPALKSLATAMIPMGCGPFAGGPVSSLPAILLLSGSDTRPAAGVPSVGRDAGAAVSSEAAATAPAGACGAACDLMFTNTLAGFDCESRRATSATWKLITCKCPSMLFNNVSLCREPCVSAACTAPPAFA